MTMISSFDIVSTLLLVGVSVIVVEAFTPSSMLVSHQNSRIIDSQSSISTTTTTTTTTTRFQRNHLTFLRYSGAFYGDDEDEDDEDEDDDDLIDPDSLGDWRTFRRNLATTTATTTLSPSVEDNDEDDSSLFAQVGASSSTSSKSSSSSSSSPSSKKTDSSKRKSVSKDNEEVLFSQNKDLAKEYIAGVWAHETSTPEVGGLLARMPLEAELRRNYRHSVMGQKLRKLVDDDNAEVAVWFARAQKLVDQEMQTIAAAADDSGQIDVTTLSEESKEMLSLYLDNQETWQEVCLVLEHDEGTGEAKTLVLNRPMAMKLTDNLGKLVLFGAFSTTKLANTKNIDEDMTFASRKDLTNFMVAFGEECAVYVGGPDHQDKPAIMIHGIPDLPGATELSPGSNLYRGGIEAAIQGVLDGKYEPLEFRFFVGCHSYKEYSMELSVHLGKYQPIASARSVALKQCISLPKPLWHEVLELCGGELEDISSVELLKRDDLQYQVIEDVEELLEDDDDEIPDELGELENFDEDEDEYY